MCLQLFKNLFEEGLTLQRERLRELRKYARDKRTEQQKRQQNEIASLENYYKDQFTVLAETLQSEKTELRMRDKAQTDVSTGWFRDSKFPKCDSWPGSSSAILIVERKAALAKNDVTFFINTSQKLLLHGFAVYFFQQSRCMSVSLRCSKCKKERTFWKFIRPRTNYLASARRSTP